MNRPTIDDSVSLEVLPHNVTAAKADKMRRTREKGKGNWLALAILACMAIGAMIYANGYLDGKAAAVKELATHSG